MKKIIGLFLALFLMSPYAFAGKPDKMPHQGKTETSAAERVGNETADAIADVLTGKDTKKTTTTTGAMPPGLAKKGKTPPGWDKGKKTGWTKTEVVKEEGESPIHKFIKGLFAPKNQQPAQQ